MVDKRKLLIMLTEALVFEEITVTPLLHEFLTRVGKSELDEMVKLTASEKTHHMLEETVEHSKTLSEIIRGVAESDRDEY